MIAVLYAALLSSAVAFDYWDTLRTNPYVGRHRKTEQGRHRR